MDERITNHCVKCGGAGLVYYNKQGYWVQCQNANAGCPVSTSTYKKKWQAISAWNRLIVHGLGGIS